MNQTVLSQPDKTTVSRKKRATASRMNQSTVSQRQCELLNTFRPLKTFRENNDNNENNDNRRISLSDKASEKKRRIKIETRNLCFYYGKQQTLFDNNLCIEENRITAIIGPSGCGKSTHLRVYNRIFELYRGQRATGQILLDGENILEKADLLELRRKVGMIFQKPTPFPMTVFENIAYPLRLHFKLTKSEIVDRVEDSLRRVSLWNEVKDKLGTSGLALSGGQQQRLCMARAIAVEPEILLMDEPTSAIDPVVTLKIEDTILELKERYTIVIVTHNMQQAARLSDFTAFFYQGKIVEFGETNQIFTNPVQKQTENYITGRFG